MSTASKELTIRQQALANEQPLSLVEASQLVILDPEQLAFSQKGADLRLTIGGERSVRRVQVYRAYPLSEPTRYLSVCDDGDNEVGILVDPSALSVQNRELVEKHLDRRYLVPIVLSVVAIKERFGTLEWTMETDRGPCTFTTRNLRENSMRPSPGRIIIQDVDGNRYDVRDVDALSKKSQDLLYKYM